jgi:hypothetical protein
MCKSKEDKLVKIYISEYTKLKDEQLKRISFRDVTIPLSVFFISAPLLSIVFARGESSIVYGHYLFLLIPWLCVALGWAYISNDEKISTLGDYFREHLRKKIAVTDEFTKEEINTLFGWEDFHKEDTHKVARKWSQYVVNQLIFVVSGFVAIICFFILHEWSLSTVLIIETLMMTFLVVLICAEVFLLVRLAIWIHIYSGPPYRRKPESTLQTDE